MEGVARYVGKKGKGASEKILMKPLVDQKIIEISFSVFRRFTISAVLLLCRFLMLVSKELRVSR